MSNKVNVERLKGGAWAVTFSQGTQRPEAVFKSKADAVTNARSKVPPGKVIVHTSTGQILRPPVVKPSRAPNVMRKAVLEAVRAETANKPKERVRK